MFDTDAFWRLFEAMKTIADAVPETRTCWGESSATDDGCYRVTTTLTTQADQWRVSKGILDGQNRYSSAFAAMSVAVAARGSLPFGQ